MGLVLLITVAAVAAALLAGVLRGRGPRHPFPMGSPEADASTLTALRQAGVDLTREIDIVFSLYFDRREQAERAAASIANPPFVPAVEPIPDTARWVCRVRAHIVPSSPAIRDASIRLQAVAATMGGNYDGWEAAGTSTGATVGDQEPMAGEVPLASPPVNAVVKWLVALIMYVKGPHRLLRHQRVAPAQAPTRLSAADEMAMPGELRTYLSETDRVLARLGFGSPVHVSMSPTAQVTAYASLLEDAHRETLCTVFATRNVRGGSTAGLVFRSDVVGGGVVMTSNSRTQRRFPRRRGHDVMSFPEITDPAVLLRLHRYRVHERAGGSSPLSVTRQPDPLAYQRREAAQTHEHLQQIGYYRRLADGTLRPTWKGAICVIWRAKFPWARLTDARDEWARRAQLARYAVANP